MASLLVLQITDVGHDVTLVPRNLIVKPWGIYSQGEAIGAWGNLGHEKVMTREDHQFRIRLPAMLRVELMELAAANRRSINAEIVARLVESVEQEMVQKWVAGDEYLPTVSDFERLDAQQARDVVLALMRIKEIFEPIAQDRAKALEGVGPTPPSYVDHESPQSLIDEANKLKAASEGLIKMADKKIAKQSVANKNVKAQSKKK